MFNLKSFNFKRGLGAGVLVFSLYVTALGLVANLLVPFLPTGSHYVAYGVQALMYVLLAGIVYIIAKWYFTGHDTGCTNGALLGLMLIVMYVIISLTQIVPSVVSVGGWTGIMTNGLISFFIKNVDLWISAVVMLGTSVITARVLKTKQAQACDVKEAVGTCMPEDSQHTC